MTATLLPSATGQTGRTSSGRSFDRSAVLGPHNEDIGNGHFKVRLRSGKAVYTHGPDYAESHGLSIAPGDPERAPACATDYYQEVLYARPMTTSDRYSTSKSTIQASMRRIDAVLNEASVASGNTSADYKVLCDGTGNVAVGQFVNAASFSLEDIINAAQAAGFNKPNVNYTIFYDGAGPSGTCGIGTLYWDERLSSSNYNNQGGGYAVSYSGCWEMVPMHENGHNMGAVQYYAPNGTGDGAHCQDEQDVMCYADGGNRYTGLVYRCNDEIKFDCNYDDYFDSAPESGEYLSSHWNLGSALNRFIQFGGGGSSTPPPPPPSTWTRVEQSSSSVSYSGTWYTYSSTYASGGTYRRSTMTGAYARYSFTGTGVRWIGERGLYGGKAEVRVDGVLVATIDQYASSNQWKRVMFEKTGLVSGPHTLEVRVTGKRNPYSYGTRTYVDAFERYA